MFTVKRLIKIPNKNFDDLNAREVASMIEADSAISPQGNEEFASSALDDFLYNASLSRPELLEIRRTILANIYLPVDGRGSMVNKDFLTLLASRLKRDGHF